MEPVGGSQAAYPSDTKQHRREPQESSQGKRRAPSKGGIMV